MHAAQKALDASHEHSRQHFAMRPSEMSVQGVSLQQVNDTSTAALNTMAEAEALLGAVSIPQLPQEGQIGSSRHIEANDTRQSNHHSDPQPASRSQSENHTHDAPALASDLNPASLRGSHTAKDETDGVELSQAHPESPSKVKSRYDTDLSDNDGATSAPSSDAGADGLEDATMGSLKQGIDAVAVSESVDRHKVGMSAETLESVDLAGSDGNSDYSGGASDDDDDVQASP